jgi:geranylgeranyl diphosphate synthase type II
VYVQEVETALNSVLSEYKEPADLYDPVHYLFEAGGKRIRPVLVLLAAEAVGGKRSSAMHAALAAELMHNFTLVHDDIMDRSNLRRGRPTLHVRYGENAAILSGDVVFGIATRLVAMSAVHASDPAAVYDRFAKAFIEVCEGQAMDMAFMHRSDVTLDEYFHMIERKTAKLLEMCVAIGAMVGGGTAPQIEALRTFARDLGVAFQMQDDVLDLDGSEAFGKMPGGDLIEGKRTWLVLRARDMVRSSHPQYRELIDQFFAQGGATPEMVPHLRTALVEMGVVDEARGIVQHLTNDAYVHLRLLPHTLERDLLDELAHQLMGRVT